MKNKLLGIFKRLTIKSREPNKSESEMIIETLEFLKKWTLTAYDPKEIGRKISKLKSMNFVVEDKDIYSESASAWTDMKNTIHLRSYLFNPEDTYLQNNIAHELVHVIQGENILFRSLIKLPYFRNKAEKTATEFGNDFEIWYKKEKGK